jgi:hypothetical protein
MNFDAQNERTESGNRQRSRRSRGGKRRDEGSPPVIEANDPPPQAPVKPEPAPVAPLAFTRPPEIAAPTDHMDVYCEYHSPALPAIDPIEYRRDMATLRHLAVDRFGGATLYCDCLHNGPHAWPPTMQKLKTAIELDQFLAASTSEA